MATLHVFAGGEKSQARSSKHLIRTTDVSRKPAGKRAPMKTNPESLAGFVLIVVRGK